MTTFIVNLGTNPLSMEEVNRIENSYICPSGTTLVDESLNLREDTVSKLTDLWRTLSTQLGDRDEVPLDLLIFIVPAGIWTLSLVQSIALMTHECELKDKKYLMPTYVILREDGCMGHLN